MIKLDRFKFDRKKSQYNLEVAKRINNRTNDVYGTYSEALNDGSAGINIIRLWND